MTCEFADICPKSESEYCLSICQMNGAKYVLDRAFIPKAEIPRIYLDAELDKLQIDRSMMPVTDYITRVTELVDAGKGYFLHGGPGTGKTTLGCITLKRYLFNSVWVNPDIERRYVLYLNLPEFLDRLRRSINSPDEGLNELLEDLRSPIRAPKLILFDDIGAEKPSAWVTERLYSIINFRVANGLSCLYTSNLPPEKLTETLGERVYSRILGSARVIRLDGADHRGCSW